MHGAGLTHALFLPANASLIELSTSSYSGSDHFASIAAWRQLHYERWVDLGISDWSAVIQPPVVGTLIAKAVRRACPHSRAVELGALFSDG